MPTVVSDASVMICLGATQQLHFLQQFYQRIVVPDAAWREVTASGSLPGAQEWLLAHQRVWLQVQTPRNHSLVVQLQTTLDAGEAQAIALAADLGADLLLMDESEGRASA